MLKTRITMTIEYQGVETDNVLLSDAQLIEKICNAYNEIDGVDVETVEILER